MPNEWGIYDMLGNVWEWCGDSYLKDTNQNSNSIKLLKGGCALNDFCFLHPLCRSTKEHNEKDSITGFRIALVKKNNEISYLKV